jgi:hypothetical protein
MPLRWRHELCFVRTVKGISVTIRKIILAAAAASGIATFGLGLSVVSAEAHARYYHHQHCDYWYWWFGRKYCGHYFHFHF